VARVRSFVALVAVAMLSGWLGIRHLPKRAEADVVSMAAGCRWRCCEVF
jgi:hypothetical protein